ncbi:MAG: hypothetical protein KDC38_08245 [Planctomycetes bacterium]|nr:hypothetical protein [Planctomycetota bacterium]
MSMRALSSLFLVLGLLVAVTTPVRAGAGSDLFIRGDANEDSLVDIGDAVFILSGLFGLGPLPNCPDAADTNDDGGNDVADAVYLLSFLFVPGSPVPAEPFPAPGTDLTADGLICGPICVDVATFESLFVSSFPTTVCVPTGTFSGSGFTIEYCNQTTAPACLGVAGCEALIELNSFTYDLGTLEGVASLTVTVDPIGITYSSALFSGSCDGSLVLDVDATLIATGMVVAPGVTEITDAVIDLMIVNTDLDLSACGAIGFLAPLFVSTVVDPLEAEFEMLAQDQIAPLAVGVQLCTP